MSGEFAKGMLLKVTEFIHDLQMFHTISIS